MNPHDDSTRLSAKILERLGARGDLATRYERRETVARGGQGVVHQVWDRDIGRTLAMKVLTDPATQGSPEASSRSLGRFLEEAQVTGQLEHPGIVPVHELGLDEEGRVYFTMRLVRGETLTSVFEKARTEREGWTRMRVIDVLVKVCEAVAFAHSKGVIHRDLKPANIMVGRFGQVFVMDWGLARVEGEEDPHATRLAPAEGRRLSSELRDTPKLGDSPVLTLDGDVMGTPQYMPPEQARGEVSKLGPAADVYAVGALLYEWLAGHPPYVEPGMRPTPWSLVHAVREGPPRALGGESVDSELAAICERAMRRDPAERYEPMEALRRDLAAYQEDRVVAAYEAGAWAELRKWLRRNRALATAFVAVLLVGVVGLVVNLDLIGEADASALEAERSAARASEHREEFVKLSASQDVEDLFEEISRLGPPHPARLELHRDWIRRAQRLVDELPAHRRLWDELGARLSGSAAASAGPKDGPRSSREQDDLWWHRQLGELIGSLEMLEASQLSTAIDAMSVEAGWSVARRSELASELQESFGQGGEFARRWAEALPAIRAAYPGLDLRVQMALVPLGPDPDSGLWEFWHVPSGDEPVRGADGRWRLEEGTGFVFVLVPGGSFWMGSQDIDPDERNYDPDSYEREEHVHEVELSPFFLSKYEASQAQWARLTGADPSQRTEENREYLEGRLHPVEQVNWHQATRTLGSLGLQLPTEAQWEYAARAGSSTPCPWPAEETYRHANLRDESFLAEFSEIQGLPWDDGWPAHAPVGSLEPNAWGFHDLIGNVYEWCRDEFFPESYFVLPREDPLGWLHGDRARVVRGAGWYTMRTNVARVAYRDIQAADRLAGVIGFRPARELDR